MDCIPHDILIAKLNVYCFEKNTLTLLELLGVTIDNELKFDQHITGFTNQQDVSLMLFSN